MKYGKKKMFSFLAIILIVVSISNCFFTVNAAPKIKSSSVTLNISKTTVNIGEVVVLQGTMNPTDTLKWKSKDKTIAKVTKNGVVTGIKEGTTTITVETSSGKMATCQINIIKNWTDKDVLELIEDNTLDETKIKEIISNSTLSKDEIMKLFEDVTKNISNNYTTINQRD